jgi:hypothetical protein
MKILSNTQLLNNKCLDIQSNVLPDTRPRAQSKSNPWRHNNCFLKPTESTKKQSGENSAEHEKDKNASEIKVTCVDLRTSAKAPPANVFLVSSGIASNSATIWWCWRIPFPLLSIL